jgi:translation initiation factor 2 beta subunit (eIF-2beta)/eIF-5
MNIYDITLKDIKRISYSEDVYTRGYDYYSKGFVEKWDITDNILTAKVKGVCFPFYTVTVSEGTGSLITCCDCPCEFNGCKHIVATLYKWLEVCGRTEKKTSEQSIKELLYSSSKEELIKLILDICDRKPEFEMDIYMVLSRYFPPGEKTIGPGIRKILDELYGIYRNYKDLTDYKEILINTEKLRELADTVKNSGLSLSDRAELYWSVAETGLKVIEEYGNIHKRLFSVVRSCFIDYLRFMPDLCLTELERYFRLDILSIYLLKYGYEADKDFRVPLVKSFYREKELDFLIRKVRKELYAPEHNDFYFCFLISFLSELYLARDDEENFLELQMANLIKIEDYERLIDYFTLKGDEDKAFELAREGCRLTGDKTGLYEFLEDVYERRRDKKRLLRVILRHFEDEPSEFLYGKILSLTRETGEKVKLNADSTVILMKFLIRDEFFDEAIELAYKTENISIKGLVAEKVSNRKASDAINIYRDIVLFCINKGTTRYYRKALKYLRDVKSIYMDILTDHSGWEEFTDYIKNNFSRKAVIKIFKEL